MKVFNPFQKYYYTVDIWEFEEVPDGQGGNVKNYSYTRTIDVQVQSELGVPRLRLISDEPVLLASRVFNLRDRDGKVIMPAGSFYSTTTCAPILNFTGQFEGQYSVAAALGFMGDFE